MMAGLMPKCFASDSVDPAVAFDAADLEDPSVGLSYSRELGTAHMEDACEELEKTERDSVGKKKRAEMWQDAEMDALVSAYKQVHMKLLMAGKNGKHVFKSANEKWTEVRNLLLPMGVDRQPKEIERKWSNLLTAYKQIVDWNKKLGHPSYWELDDVLKKEKTKAKELPATFRVQLFESMAEFLGDRNGRRSRSWEPNALSGASVPNTSAIVPLSTSNPISRLAPPTEFGLVDVPICVDKLGSQLHRSLDGSHRRPAVVLVSTGSFNPPTIMHLRMFELAKNRLMLDGYNVLGGYMSPVNDAYGKPGLAPAEHRIRLCQLATMESPFIMVDSWEARQGSYQRTLDVLNRVDHAVNGSGIIAEGTVRVMFLCGADVLASFNAPGVWIPDQVDAICRNYGIVCISREGSNTSKTIFENDILFDNQKGIVAVEDMGQINISSTFLRQCFARGCSVKYLTPDGVIEYVKMHRLYNYKEIL